MRSLANRLLHRRRREPLGFVVAATPRSGTKYTAELLQQLNIHCGHERCFSPRRLRTYVETADDDPADAFGDASWLVVPHLRRLRRSTVILHQVRHPVRAINSIIGVGQCNWDGPRDPGPGIDFARWLRRQTRRWPWPEDQAGRAVLFWTRWNEWIERTSRRRPTLRYRIESMSPQLLKEMLEMIGVRPPGDDALTAALDAVSTSTNRRGDPPGVVTWDELPEATRRLAERYGYRPGSD
jgi:hypothetical protein